MQVVGFDPGLTVEGAWQHGETLFVNATTWECERMPTVIDLDADGARPALVPPARK